MRILFVLLAACADLDSATQYQPATPLDQDAQRLSAEAVKRELTNDPEVIVALEKVLLEGELALRKKALQRELTDDEKKHVQALLVTRAKGSTLADTARASGYLQHPLVVQQLITALEDDELKKTPPTKAKLKAVFEEHLESFDESDRAPPSGRLHPELLYVRVWETKNKALAAAIPKLPSPPASRDVGPIARDSAALPTAAVTAAFAVEKPLGFSAPIANAGQFLVVQRITKLPPSAYSETVARALYERERRPAIRRALLAKEPH